jgi:hypothetical protein
MTPRLRPLPPPLASSRSRGMVADVRASVRERPRESPRARFHERAIYSGRTNKPRRVLSLSLSLSVCLSVCLSYSLDGLSSKEMGATRARASGRSLGSLNYYGSCRECLFVPFLSPTAVRQPSPRSRQEGGKKQGRGRGEKGVKSVTS